MFRFSRRYAEDSSDDAAPMDADGSPDELVAPEVDEGVVTELEAMGFGRHRAVRAVHATGTSSVEQAVNWIVEHEADADIDEPLLVKKTAAKKKLTKVGETEPRCDARFEPDGVTGERASSLFFWSA